MRDRDNDVHIIFPGDWLKTVICAGLSLWLQTSQGKTRTLSCQWALCSSRAFSLQEYWSPPLRWAQVWSHLHYCYKCRIECICYSGQMLTVWKWQICVLTPKVILLQVQPQVFSATSRDTWILHFPLLAAQQTNTNSFHQDLSWNTRYRMKHTNI